MRFECSAANNYVWQSSTRELGISLAWLHSRSWQILHVCKRGNRQLSKMRRRVLRRAPPIRWSLCQITNTVTRLSASHLKLAHISMARSHGVSIWSSTQLSNLRSSHLYKRHLPHEVSNENQLTSVPFIFLN